MERFKSPADVALEDRVWYLGSAGGTTGLKNLRGLFQLKEFCDSLPIETLKMEDAPC